MRRKDREVTDKQELRDIIDTCKVCRVATSDGQGLYIIPLNFGYLYEEEKLTLYIHSAKLGRKTEAFAADAHIAFEMDCGHRLLEGKVACQYGFTFRSITGTGEIHLVDDVEEKKLGLTAMMKHQTGQDFAFEDRMVNAVAVYRIDVTEFTGKQRLS